MEQGERETSLSVSGLHFSHYKAGAKSDLISHLHALKTSVFSKERSVSSKMGKRAVGDA